MRTFKKLVIGDLIFRINFFMSPVKWDKKKQTWVDKPGEKINTLMIKTDNGYKIVLLPYPPGIMPENENEWLIEHPNATQAALWAMRETQKAQGEKTISCCGQGWKIQGKIIRNICLEKEEIEKLKKFKNLTSTK